MRRSREEVAAPASCRAGPPVDWRIRYISYELTLAGGGEAISSYTIRPGTTPVARDGRFRAASPRLRAHVPGESLQAPELSFPRTLPCERVRLVHKPSEADGVDQPQCQKKRPDTGTAKTHKGQRDTGHRHESRYHSHIDKNVEQQQSCHPHT